MAGGCVLVAAGCAESAAPADGITPTSQVTATVERSVKATAASPPSPSPTSPRPSVTLLHPRLWEQARRDAPGNGQAMDFRPMLAAIEPHVSTANLAVCHMETPLADRDGPFSGYPLFSGPPQIVPALAAAGYDACSTASNHTFDQGAAGVKRTLESMDAAGLAHAGSARSRSESRRITLMTAAGVRVALLSYTYGFNGIDYPGGQSWRANVIDVSRIKADAARARAQGARIVVLAMHWGTEYQQKPSEQQRRVAPELARSGAVDLILSHHAHVVESIQKIGPTWVVYGLGNMIASHATPGPANAEGLLVRFTFTPGGSGRYSVTGAEYLPLLMTRSTPIRLLDVPRALQAGEYGSTTRSRLREALTRTTRVVESLGAEEKGLVPMRPTAR